MGEWATVSDRSPCEAQAAGWSPTEEPLRRIPSVGRRKPPSPREAEEAGRSRPKDFRRSGGTDPGWQRREPLARQRRQGGAVPPGAEVRL